MLRTRRVTATLVFALAAGVGVPVLSATPAAAEHSRQRVTLEGHRGARGLRPENTLPAMAIALKTGVDILELDTGVTQDGVVVLSHERRASTLECQDTGPAFAGDPEWPYIGKLWKDLTLTQVKTLDCGRRTPPDPANDPFAGTQEPVPGTRMPTLAEVFELADRYGARGVTFDIETKLDPTRPEETVDPQTFAAKVVGVIAAHGKTRRSVLQSFDWRTLVAARELAPRLKLAALAQQSTIYPGTPWTAGVEVGDAPFEGDLARLAKSIGAEVLSVRHNDVTDALIRAAHRRGLLLIVWTVNDVPSMQALIDRGVDGLITDYPDRGRVALASRGLRLPRRYASPFDVQGHRGARARRPENTLSAFRYALDRGVTTLELDTGVTKDGHLVVLHDRRINGAHCIGPYVGQLVRDLTLAQVKELDCGTKTDPGFPEQVAQPGERIPALQEVFDLLRSRGDDTTRLNIETKISPLVDDTVPYDVFTRLLVRAIERNGFARRTTIQSFDWRTILLATRLTKRIGTVALVWQFAGVDCDALDDECSLQAVMGDPSVKSPWTAGLDWWRSRDLARLVRAARADVVSSNWQVHDPNLGHVESSDWYAKEDPAMYHGPSVAELQRRGIKVIPYTVNDERTMQRVVDLGVDGLISDDVDLLLLVAKRNGLA